jgi:hypothetical protein
LGHDLPRVEFDEHGGIRIEILDRDEKLEIVEE